MVHIKEEPKPLTFEKRRWKRAVWDNSGV